MPLPHFILKIRNNGSGRFRLFVQRAPPASENHSEEVFSISLLTNVSVRRMEFGLRRQGLSLSESLIFLSRCRLRAHGCYVGIDGLTVMPFLHWLSNEATATLPRRRMKPLSVRPALGEEFSSPTDHQVPNPPGAAQ
ncbi:hypothetical protein DPEC_G00004920 [Dallia pectoralis]|uniref:Uncharacterized protein n=1 Tax=Dallia pectoralis TaxID=75939 RepID=A0ACC2HJS3_DALPE|nr:hypothetical protein DPEC_G00004920 [Dallia pectoralis]